MKRRILYLAIFALLPVLAQGQSRKYYVVIGVFAKIDNAIRFTDKANKDKFNAHYAVNPSRKLYYVYVLQSDQLRDAFPFMMKMRTETEHRQTWIFIGQLGDEQGGHVEDPPVVEKPIEKPVEKPIEEKPVEVKKDTVSFEPAVDSSTIVKPEPKPEEPKPVVKKPEGKPFYFKLTSPEGTEVVGEVHVQESANATQYQAFRANEIAYLKTPANRNGTYTVTTQAPGYQQVTRTLTYTEPGLALGDQGESIMPIELQKAKAGNYIDFNNVRFVRNSSIMNPESQNELDGLVALMNGNPNYKIKIHGHVNGKLNREIIINGTSEKFFAMDPAHNKKETTTAKVLSEERAKAVKAYLMSKGIAASRIAIKAEGGRIPLYPEGSTLAGYNDRVEVEVQKN